MSEMLDKQEWITIVERKHSLLFFDLLSQGQGSKAMQHTFGIPVGFDEFQKIGLAYKIKRARMGPFTGWFQKTIEDDPSFLQSFPAYCYDLADELIRYAKASLSVAELRALSKEELGTLITEYFEKLQYTLPLVGAGAGFQMTVETYVRQELAHRLEEAAITNVTVDDCLRILVSPKKNNYIIEDLRSVRSLANVVLNEPRLQALFISNRENLSLEVDREFPEFANGIKRHIEQFGWLKSLYTQGESANAEDIIERIKTKICEDESPSNLRETSQGENRQAEDLAAVLGIEGHLRESIDALAEMMHLYTFRMDVMFIANHHAKPLLEEAASRMHCTYESFIYLLREEVEEFFITGETPDWETVAERKSGFAYTSDGFDRSLITGEEYCKLVAQQKRSLTLRDDIIGMCANPGYAAGLVRLVLTADQVQKVKSGDVLVTTMTTPDLVLGMERAGAIVTDEGGIGCHAAIVSRELGIPCVIGTRDGSKVLKDYDAVVVDASAGHVIKVKWSKVVRRASPLLWKARSLMGHTKQVFRESLDMKEAGFDFLKSVDHQTWASTKELREFSATLKHAVEGDILYLERVARNCTNRADDLLSVAAEIGRRSDLEELTKRDLRELFDRYNQEYLQVVPFRGIINILAAELDGIIRERLQQHVRTPLNEEWIEALILPTRESFYLTELLDLLQLADAVNADQKLVGLFTRESSDIVKEVPQVSAELDVQLGRHLEEFGWMGMARSAEGEWQKVDLIERIKEIPPSEALAKHRELSNRQEALRERKKELAYELGLDDDLKNLIDLAGDYAFLRQYRIDIFFIADCRIQPLEKAIQRSLGIDRQDFVCMTPDEIMGALDGKGLPSQKDLKARKTEYALVDIGGRLDVIPNEDISLVREQSGVSSSLKEVKGIVANAGEQIGRACILMSRDDTEDCQEGDVLVSPMTTPEMVEAFEKASAIVTDEGGVLCHAAIISRELGIPCVIGTGFATEVFRTGQLIHVEATAREGLVRLINR